MQVRFLPITDATLDRTLNLMAKLYATLGATFNRRRARLATQWLMAHPETGGVWLLDADGVIAGYVVVSLCFSLEFGGSYGLLDELYVEPEFRSGGMGAKAIQFAERFCRKRGLKALRLEVALGNSRARELYQRRGFDEPNVYLMTKWL